MVIRQIVMIGVFHSILSCHGRKSPSVGNKTKQKKSPAAFSPFIILHYKRHICKTVDRRSYICKTFPEHRGASFVCAPSRWGVGETLIWICKQGALCVPFSFKRFGIFILGRIINLWKLDGIHSLLLLLFTPVIYPVWHCQHVFCEKCCKTLQVRGQQLRVGISDFQSKYVPMFLTEKTRTPAAADLTNYHTFKEAGGVR